MNIYGDIHITKTIHQYFQEAMAQAYAAKHRKILKTQDLDFINSFLTLTEHNDPHTRILKINRIFIDQPDKPKNWAYIAEAMTWANSRQLREMIETAQAAIDGEFLINGDSPRLKLLKADLAKLTGEK